MVIMSMAMINQQIMTRIHTHVEIVTLIGMTNRHIMSFTTVRPRSQFLLKNNVSIQQLDSHAGIFLSLSSLSILSFLFLFNECQCAEFAHTTNTKYKYMIHESPNTFLSNATKE